MGQRWRRKKLSAEASCNLAGPIQAVNADASTITVTDTATKKPVVISVTPDSEVKKLDPAVAQRMAARLSGGGARRPDGSPAGPRAPGQECRTRESGAAGPAAGPSEADRPGGLRAVGRGAEDLIFSSLLARAPSVTLKDLQKGNMVIVVATEGQTPDSPQPPSPSSPAWSPCCRPRPAEARPCFLQPGTWVAVVVRAVAVGKHRSRTKPYRQS